MITGLRPKRSETGPHTIWPKAAENRNTGTIACTHSIGAPRSRSIAQNAGSVMSQEKALMVSNRPQKTTRSALMAASVPSRLAGEAGRASYMNDAPEGIEHAFVHGLRQRRVREDRVHEVFLGGLELHGNGKALDQLGHFCADHVCAE